MPFLLAILSKIGLAWSKAWLGKTLSRGDAKTQGMAPKEFGQESRNAARLKCWTFGIPLVLSGRS